MYCFEHKLEGMINVKDKLCLYPECKARADYGKIFRPAEHCSKHRLADEFYQRYPKCNFIDCKNRPYYSDTNYPKRCEEHKLPNDSNIIETPCKGCGLSFMINNKLGYCDFCMGFKSTGRKVEELKVESLLDSNGFKIISHDKTVENGCSKYRPDFILIFGILTVVIDENQHESYCKLGEIARMIMIQQDLGGVPTLFVRYNPDKYIPKRKKSRKTKERSF